MFSLIVLEISIATLMKMDDDGHNFTLTQSRLPHPPSSPAGQLGGVLAAKILAEIIDITE